MSELERIENPDIPYKGVCRKCGKPFTLWFNGGELDEKRCCGITYALEHGDIFFVARDGK